MKKSFLYILVLLFITSCWKNELWLDLENTQKSSTWQLTESWIVKNNSQTWVLTQKITSDKPKDVMSIAIENFNVVLKKNWTTIDKLTTKATWNKECDYDSTEDQYQYKYTILNDNWKYWIVERETYKCWTDYPEKTIFWIDLLNWNELSEIYSPWFTILVKTDLNENLLNISIDIDVVETESEEMAYAISKPTLQKKWYKQIWQNWIKTINLTDFFNNKISQKDIVNENIIESTNNTSTNNWTSKKFQESDLLKNWYKLNNLWEIKEYYKATISDNNQPQNEGWTLIFYDTIYIKWTKYLQITWNNYYEWWTSGFEPTIYVNDGINNTKLVKIYDYDLFPIQPIFNKDYANKIFDKTYPFKLTVDSNLDKISVVDKSKNINDVLWNR